MKPYILILPLLLGCELPPEKDKPYVKAYGYVYNRSYICESGVLYHQGYTNTMMRDVDDNPIPCQVVYMTNKEYRNGRKI